MKVGTTNSPGYELTINTGILVWNEAFYSVFGYNKTEPLNSVEWWATHIHPEDAFQVNETLTRLLDPTLKNWDMTYRFRKADDSYIQVQDHVAVSRGSGGRAEKLTGTMTISNVV